MGACTFYTGVILVKGNMREAYNEACEEARYENGHQQGYSGDIQTTRGFVDLTKQAPRFDTKAFYKWEDNIIDNDSYGVCKWGNAAGIEITGAKLKQIKERRGLKGRKGWRAFYFFGWGAE